MAYTVRNFRSKKELREALGRGDRVVVYNPGLGGLVRDGACFLEGPHYPESHRWAAEVQVRDGAIVPGSRVK